MSTEKFYIVNEEAVPEVLIKVLEAKKLIDTEKAFTVQEAIDAVGISRSSFYKYKDAIFPFHDNSRGKTLTFMLQLDDEPGKLSIILGKIASSKANILTIHQAIPIGGIATLTLSVEVLPDTDNVEKLIQDIKEVSGVHYLKILGRE